MLGDPVPEHPVVPSISTMLQPAAKQANHSLQARGVGRGAKEQVWAVI